MKRRAIELGLTVCLAGLPAAARAQTMPAPEAAIDLFQPAPAPQTFLQVEQAGVLGEFQLAAGLLADYQHDPYQVSLVNGNQLGSTVTTVVGSAYTGEAMLALGLPASLQLGLSLPYSGASGQGPFTIDSSGQPVAGTGFQSAGLGDARLELKWLAYEGPQGLALALAPIVTVPTHGSGPKEDLIGEKGVTVWPRVLVSWASPGGRFAVGANLGAYLRTAPQQYYTNDFGQELTFGLAASYQALPALALLAEAAGHSGLGKDFANLDESPVEADAGVRWALDFTSWIQVGVGTGLVAGVGAPDFRAVTAFVYDPSFPDRDHDGVPDALDQCPDQPEDRDGFQDADGCPDPDNDGDGIPDTQDLCPNEPEDLDGFQDTDGCPDPDNDGDGVPDAQDKCPNAAEDGQPPDAHDGCPASMADSDGDGIPDAQDKCPNQKEDGQPPNPSDGCPASASDSDHDGITDDKDQCPTEPEDRDGFKDDDGCPDPDNDLDGIPDAKDKCPNQPETVNGFEDEDGCPDRGGRTLARFAGDRIKVDGRVEFRDKYSTTLKQLPKNDLLNQVALVMLQHPEVSKWKIVASAGKGLPASLGQKRAVSVRAYLIDRGVKAELLDAEGVAAPVDAVGFAVETQGAIPPDEGQGGNDQTPAAAPADDQAPESPAPPSPPPDQNNQGGQGGSMNFGQ